MTDFSTWTLEQYKEIAELCVNCGACYARGPIVPHNWRELPPPEWSSPPHKCPSFEYFGFRSHTGYGRILLGALFYKGRTAISRDLIEIAYTCTSCGVCNEICPVYQPLYGILALRQAIVESSMPPPEPLGKIGENIKEHQNIFGLEKRAKPVEGLPLKGDHMYFAGCYSSYLLPRIARAAVAILQAAGVDIAYLNEEERCCGEMLRQQGNLKQFEEQAHSNIEAMRRAGVKKLITSCAHCYRTWKVDYPNVAGKLPFEVVHLSQLLPELLEEGRIKFRSEVKRDITYHDPCFLGRLGGQVYDAPRKVLTCVPGVELKEMERYARWAYCCGGGGKITLNCYPEFAYAVGRDRVIEAKGTANTLVTACPVCFSHMGRVARKEGIELEVEDLGVMVAEAMGADLNG